MMRVVASALALLAATVTVGHAGLVDPKPCSDQPGFACSTLVVPLDYARSRGTLRLAVAAATNAAAPRGVLVVLTGGPGQPGAQYAARNAEWLGAVAAEYRLVMVD